MDGANKNTNLRMNVIYCQIHNAMEAGGGGRTFEGGTGVRADRHVACGESMRLGGSPFLGGFGAIVVSGR